MLSPGTIIRVPVQFKNGEPKYLLILEIDRTEAHCLVINTRIHRLFGSSLFRSFFVPIQVATHPFMHHDSYVDCNEVKRLALFDIYVEINNDETCIKGEITSDLREAVVAAMSGTPGLTLDEKKRYCASLSGGQSAS